MGRGQRSAAGAETHFAPLPMAPEQTHQHMQLDAPHSIATHAASPPTQHASPQRRATLLASLADSSVSTSAPRAPASGAASSRRLGGSAAAGRAAEDSGEESEVGSDDGGVNSDVFGNLKTSLVWDCAGRRLCLSARQYLETPRKLEVKMRGMLDTASGQHRIWGHVRRNFYTHVPLLQRLLSAQAQRQAGSWVDEPDLDPEALLPGGLRCLLLQDWCIAPGVSYDTARSPPLPPSASASAGFGGGGGQGLPALLGQRIRYQLAIRKNPQVIKNGTTADLWVQARALAEFDPKVSEVTLGGSLRLKAIKYGVTGGQDLRMTAGLDMMHDDQGRMVRMPYLHVSDGKLGARLQHRRWQLTYTL